MARMHPAHAANAVRLAIRYAAHLGAENSLTTPAALDHLAATGPVGEKLAELNWQTLAGAMGEARCPSPATRAMIRVLCDQALNDQANAMARAALDVEGPAEVPAAV